ncbi:MAG TPA: kelch repeat-containing protein [Flavitalea sp.]|nr:kelch repeat-containing protein [Flavitalea sp.]
MHGTKSPDVQSNYGTLGTSSTSGMPGSRFGMATWTDNYGNFWLFGGNGKGESSASGYLNDLWKFNPASGLWTWEGGSKKINSSGRYGTKGIASVNNIPGARQNAMYWTDTHGNFWLYGGLGIISTKDKKEEDNNNGGSNSGTGGGGNNGKGKGKDDKNDHDGKKGNHNEGEGHGQDHGGNNIELETSEGLLNDLWMYSPDTHEWTFMKGTDQLNQKGEYGNQSELSGSNEPGGRMMCTGWIDSNGNLWMFGGKGYSSKSEISYLNDVWKYSIASGKWAWMNGSNSNNADAHFGDQGSYGNDNSPGGRHGSTSWTDKNGNLWMFGGGTKADVYNDLWKYDPASNKWAWISGNKNANLPPAFKSAGIPDQNNNPGSRIAASGWADNQGNLWLFGGEGYGTQGTDPLNNLWMYDASSNEWTFIKGEIPGNTDAIFGNKSEASQDNNPAGTADFAKWKDGKGNFWIFGGRSSAGYLNQTWKFFACNGIVTGTISPNAVSLCGGNSQVLTATGGASYTWMLNGEIMNGENNESVTVTQPGTYSVIIDNGGCRGTASNTVVVTNKSSIGIRYPDVLATPDVPVQLKAREIGVAYEWKPAIGLNITSSVIPMVTTSAEREYTVKITTEQGCTITDTVVVKINGDKKVFVPTAFTPNGNGVNDRLRPLGNISTIDYFRVFNRWGALLFQTSESGDGWDGRYKGIMQPSETYTWVLSGKASDGQPLKLSGKTLLIR